MAADADANAMDERRDHLHVTAWRRGVTRARVLLERDIAEPETAALFASVGRLAPG
jgi:hypothetical protein